MKRIALLMAFVLVMVSAAYAADAGFEVKRLVITSGISDREPMDEATEFMSDVQRVYCFLEAVNIRESTNVTFLWMYEGQETGRVELALGQGGRWRTHSNAQIAGRKGQWKVELLDASGNMVDSASFMVK